jgi:hypothetical protein
MYDYENYDDIANYTGDYRTGQSWTGHVSKLNFEAADTVGYSPPTGMPSALAFPGWQTSIGATPISSVGYDNPSLSTPWIYLGDSEAGNIIQGNYSAFLQSSTIGSGSATLSQTGIVPPGTESIQLDANEENSGSFAVMLGGDNITMFSLQSFPGYTLYGGNASAWGGQDATLSITQLPPANSGPQFVPSLLELDNITFSPGAVPEPSALALTGIGGILFALYRRFAPRRQ